MGEWWGRETFGYGPEGVNFSFEGFWGLRSEDAPICVLRGSKPLEGRRVLHKELFSPFALFNFTPDLKGNLPGS